MDAFIIYRDGIYIPIRVFVNGEIYAGDGFGADVFGFAEVRGW